MQYCRRCKEFLKQWKYFNEIFKDYKNVSVNSKILVKNRCWLSRNCILSTGSLGHFSKPLGSSSVITPFTRQQRKDLLGTKFYGTEKYQSVVTDVVFVEFFRSEVLYLFYFWYFSLRFSELRRKMLTIEMLHVSVMSTNNIRKSVWLSTCLCAIHDITQLWGMCI